MIFLDWLKKKYNLIQLILLELFITFLIGIVMAMLTQNSYLKNSDYVDAMLLSDFGELDKIQLFVFVLQKRLKDFLVIWILGVTILAIPYNVFIIGWKGFCTGFVTASLVNIYGASGFMKGIGLIFPQYIVYIPVFAGTVMMSYRIHSSMGTSAEQKKIKYLFSQMPAFIFLFGMTIAGALMETFLNPFVLDWVQKIF